MSRTYKDQPEWVKALRTGKIKDMHHPRCAENPETYSYWSYRNVEIVKEPHWHQEKIDHSEYWGVDNGTKWVYSSTTERHREYYVVKADQPCDLEYNRRSGAYKGGNRCRFYHDYDKSYYSYWYHPDRERRRSEFYKPERADVRNSLKRAADEYNIYGDTDEEPAPHKRNCTWGGGYWD